MLSNQDGDDELIYDQTVKSITECGYPELLLKKLDVKLVDVIEKIRDGQFRATPDRQFLNEWELISEAWPEPPPPDRLHVFVVLPGPVQESPTLVNTIGDGPVDLGFVEQYKDIFINVKNWGDFESSDVEGNGLRIYVDGPTPDFVTESEQKLDKEPSLASNEYDHVLELIDDPQFLDAYFGSPDIDLDRSVEDGSPVESTSKIEPHRRVASLELIHLAFIARCKWEQFWDGKFGGSLKEPSMNVVFFHFYAMVAHQTGKSFTVRTSSQPWPFDLIVKCKAIEDENQQLRKCRPRSDLLVSKYSFPRLLVEVNSKPKRNDRPEDLVRMLLMGAAIVRFANGFLGKYKEAKNFVLFAVYIWENGKATRFSLFQEWNEQEVCCKESTYWLNTSVGRAKFVLQLYNIRRMLESEERDDTDEKIQVLQESIEKHDKKHQMKKFHTKDTGPNTSGSGTNNTQGKKRKRVGSAEGLDATDCAELGAHGYEVEVRPQDFVGETGLVIASFSEMPSHVITIFPRSDPSKLLIAKKVLKGSNELRIFEYINALQRKSEHIISLHDSFQTQSTSWALLPRMISLAGVVRLQGKVAQVCWGLIEGVAHLHEFCVAHRDIKPDNLVLDMNFSLKIIDFDVAMRVQGEDEVIEGKCGTKGWMAPEIEEKSKYSPIRADRWSTGQVLLYLLDRFGEKDTVLRTIARKLTAHDPEQRPSMPQVAAPRTDETNVVLERKAWLPLRVTVGNGKEKAKPPSVKKRKTELYDNEMVVSLK